MVLEQELQLTSSSATGSNEKSLRLWLVGCVCVCVRVGGGGVYMRGGAQEGGLDKIRAPTMVPQCQNSPGGGRGFSN